MHCVGSAHRINGGVGQTDGLDFPLSAVIRKQPVRRILGEMGKDALDEFLENVHSNFDRDGRIRPVDVQEINVVGLESFKRCCELRLYEFGIAAGLEVLRESEFGSEEYLASETSSCDDASGKVHA